MPESKPAQDQHTASIWGCLGVLIWLAMFVFTALLLAAGWSAWSQGINKDQPSVASFGRWLMLAGAASTAILCSSIIIIMRVRRLQNRISEDEKRKG